MVQLNKFCCCCSLKCGAVFIRVVLVIISIFEAAVSIYGFTGRNIWDDLRLNRVEGDDDAPSEVETLPMATHVIYLISIIFCILSSSSLLVAACKNKASFVIPILILIPVTIIISWITDLVDIGTMQYAYA